MRRLGDGAKCAWWDSTSRWSRQRGASPDTRFFDSAQDDSCTADRCANTEHSVDCTGIELAKPFDPWKQHATFDRKSEHHQWSWYQPERLSLRNLAGHARVTKHFEVDPRIFPEFKFVEFRLVVLGLGKWPGELCHSWDVACG
jgi:hypothetical protein